MGKDKHANDLDAEGGERYSSHRAQSFDYRPLAFPMCLRQLPSHVQHNSNNSSLFLALCYLLLRLSFLRVCSAAWLQFLTVPTFNAGVFDT
jgi:hypothetical protein